MKVIEHKTELKKQLDFLQSKRSQPQQQPSQSRPDLPQQESEESINSEEDGDCMNFTKSSNHFLKN